MIGVIESPLEGRYVVALEIIPAGTLVHASDPYNICVAPEFSGLRCSWCLSSCASSAQYIGISASNVANIKKQVGGKMKSANYLALKEKMSKQNAKAKSLADKARVKKSKEEADRLLNEVDEDSQDASLAEEPTVVCSGCRAAVYCSHRCQALHAQQHIQFNECLALRLVHENAAHRKPEEVHFLSIMLQIIFRCAAEGFANRLLARDSVTESAPPASTEQQQAHHTSSAAPADRSAQTLSSIPTEAQKIRSLQARRKSVEIVDASSEADFVSRGMTLSQIMQRCTSVGNVVPVEWCDFGLLVTNASVISKDHLKDFHTLHRFFLKAIQTCPGDVFGLPPPVVIPTASPTASATSDTTLLLNVRRDTASCTAPNVVGDREVVSVEMFNRICGAIQCNGFGVYNEADRCVAIGCLPHASYFNHSCAPNLCRVMHGRQAHFFTLHDVVAGTPLCISYTDAEKSTSERRVTLLSTYRFYCECARCAGSAPLSFERCKSCSAGGYLRPLVHLEGKPYAVECSICRRQQQRTPSLPVTDNNSGTAS